MTHNPLHTWEDDGGRVTAASDAPTEYAANALLDLMLGDLEARGYPTVAEHQEARRVARFAMAAEAARGTEGAE